MRMNEGYPDNPIDFKRECRKYFFYLADVKQQMEKIRKLDHRMKGVHSIDLQRLRPQRDFRYSPIVSYIELHQALDEELKEIEDKLLYIIGTINRIGSPSFRAIIWMLYVQGKRLSEVAAIYGMSKDYLSQLVNQEIWALFPKADRSEPEPDETANLQAEENEDEVNKTEQQ